MGCRANSSVSQKLNTTKTPMEKAGAASCQVLVRLSRRGRPDSHTAHFRVNYRCLGKKSTGGMAMVLALYAFFPPGFPILFSPQSVAL